MNELALFSGCGGGILGGKLLGWRTVCAVEIDDYCRRVLMQRQDDGILEPFPIWDDVQTFDGRPWRGCVDIVTGGFPCVDISVAGKGAGINGERSGLWREMARIIRDVGPRFAFVENSPALTSRGLGTVLGDLAEMGYFARWCVLGAHHVGAPHKRDRIWILADSDSTGFQERDVASKSTGSQQHSRISSPKPLAHADSEGEPQPRGGQREKRGRVGDGGGEVPDTHSINADDRRHGAGEARREQRKSTELSRSQGEALANADSIDGREQQQQPGGNGARAWDESHGGGWWSVEPDVGRVAHGISNRVGKLRALGNAQVPLCAALAFRILAGCEL